MFDKVTLSQPLNEMSIIDETEVLNWLLLAAVFCMWQGEWEESTMMCKQLQTAKDANLVHLACASIILGTVVPTAEERLKAAKKGVQLADNIKRNRTEPLAYEYFHEILATAPGVFAEAKNEAGSGGGGINRGIPSSAPVAPLEPESWKKIRRRRYWIKEPKSQMRVECRSRERMSEVAAKKIALQRE